MSASDAAPLPRLGEVFFDVRGSSRSMRLSWYADTGVAVFSIWQGGMCTGTFRLAIGDLPRMVETLQRGPGGQPSGQDPAPGQAFSDDPLDPTARVPGLAPLPGEGRPDYQPRMAGYGPGSRTDQPAATAEYRLAPAGYPAGTAEYPAGAADYGTRTAEYGPGAADYRPGAADYRPGIADYRTERPDPLNGPAPYTTGEPGYPADPVDRRTGGSGYLADPVDHRTGMAGDYPADPVDRQTGMTGDYPAYPSDRWSGPADYPADPAGRPDASYAGRPDASYAGRPGASYPGTRAEGAYPAPSDETYLDAGPESPPYPARPDVTYPRTRAGRPRSHGGSGPGRRGADPYLGGTGPTDFPGEPAPPHYAPGTSAPGHDDAPGRSAADYPAHYSAAVTDDIEQNPPPESFPYGPPPGNRGPAGRHADSEAPFD